jgi:hypothetical protein
VKTTRDSYSTKTSGLVSSSFSQDPEFAELVAIYRNSSGAIVGGARTFADTIPAGQTVAFSMSSLIRLSVSKTELYGLL